VVDPIELCLEANFCIFVKMKVDGWLCLHSEEKLPYGCLHGSNTTKNAAWIFFWTSLRNSSQTCGKRLGFV